MCEGYLPPELRKVYLANKQDKGLIASLEILSTQIRLAKTVLADEEWAVFQMLLDNLNYQVLTQSYELQSDMLDSFRLITYYLSIRSSGNLHQDRVLHSKLRGLGFDSAINPGSKDNRILIKLTFVSKIKSL